MNSTPATFEKFSDPSISNCKTIPVFLLYSTKLVFFHPEQKENFCTMVPINKNKQPALQLTKKPIYLQKKQPIPKPNDHTLL
jgi:hypothetical protein